MEAEPCEGTQAELRYTGFKEERLIGRGNIPAKCVGSGGGGESRCSGAEWGSVGLSGAAAGRPSMKKTRGC